MTAIWRDAGALEGHVDARIRRSRALVERATVDLAREIGLAALTHQRVAERAGMSRSTIYRYWPTREDLIRAAISGVPIPFAPSHSGRLGDTLVDGIRALNASLADPASRRIALEVLAHSQEHPQTQTILSAATDRLREVIAVAIASGEITQAPKPQRMLMDALGPVLAHLLLLGEPLSELEIDATLQHALANVHFADPAPSKER